MTDHLEVGMEPVPPGPGGRNPVRGARSVSLLAFAACLAAAGSAAAQTGSAERPDTSAAASWRILPSVRFFQNPLASPIEPRLSIGLLTTNLLKYAPAGHERPPFQLPDPQDAATDVEAAAAVGVTIPLLLLARWPDGGVVVSGQVGVFDRFRIEYPSRDDLGQDWVVAMPIEIAKGNDSYRIRIGHRSSHLGDEFLVQSGARRVEFGGEWVEGLAAHTFPGIARLYGGGTIIFRSNTQYELDLLGLDRQDRLLVQLGSDGEWHPFSDPRLGLLAGVDWQAAQRTNWQGGLALAGGINVRRSALRSLGLVARYFTGATYLGEFYLTRERFYSIEVEATF